MKPVSSKLLYGCIYQLVMDISPTISCIITGINGKSMLISGGAAGGYVKQCPTAAIFPQKCGRWHFQIADGREKPAKPRPVDSILGLHRARYRNMPVSAVTGVGPLVPSVLYG